MTNKIKIIIADDHQLFRNGLKSMLVGDTCEIVGEASNGKELLEKLNTIHTDLLLLDISMPEVSGLELIEQLKIKYKSLKCIILTMHEEAQYVMESLKKGADGYLLKDSSEQELKEAISEVMRGNKHFKNKVSELLVRQISNEDRSKNILTEREIEIIRLVAEGKITKEIADQLHVSVRTVETHRSKIMKKLNVSNASEMIRMAYEKKLI